MRLSEGFSSANGWSSISWAGGGSLTDSRAWHPRNELARRTGGVFQAEPIAHNESRLGGFWIATLTVLHGARYPRSRVRAIQKTTTVRAVDFKVGAANRRLGKASLSPRKDLWL